MDFNKDNIKEIAQNAYKYLIDTKYKNIKDPQERINRIKKYLKNKNCKVVERQHALSYIKDWIENARLELITKLVHEELSKLIDQEWINTYKEENNAK